MSSCANGLWWIFGCKASFCKPCAARTGGFEFFCEISIFPESAQCRELPKWAAPHGALSATGGMMTLAELGEVLREERVRRGYSVEDVASTVKITSRVVRAIEEGDESSLPHAVYACGFIKAYAVYVGVAEEDIRPVLDALADPHEEARPVTLVTPSRRADHHRGGGGGFLPTLVVVAALVFGGWWFRAPLAETLDKLTAYVQEQTQPSRATPASSEPEQLPVTDLNAPSSSSQGTPPESAGKLADTSMVRPAQAQSERSESPATSGTASGTTSGAASTPAAGQSGLTADGLPTNLDAATINAMRGTPTDSDTPGRSAGVGTGTPLTAPDTTLTLHKDERTQTDVTRAGAGKHQIVISAVDECWVHSSADGTFTRQFSLKKGETFALSFENKLVVKLGNAGGVRIKYDGQELPPPGKPGQVRTVTFPPAPTAPADR